MSHRPLPWHAIQRAMHTRAQGSRYMGGRAGRGHPMEMKQTIRHNAVHVSLTPAVLASTCTCTDLSPILKEEASYPYR